jgi:peptidyl-tRNA hydrolase
MTKFDLATANLTGCNGGLQPALAKPMTHYNPSGSAITSVAQWQMIEKARHGKCANKNSPAASATGL